MPIRHEECMFCGEAPCQCNKPKRASKKKAVSTPKKVEPTPRPKPVVVGTDHEMNSAIRKFHHFGMLSRQEIGKHRSKLGPDRPTGALHEHLHGDEE